MSDFVIENGVLVKYAGPGGDVVIPEGVTEIGEMAFHPAMDTLDTNQRKNAVTCYLTSYERYSPGEREKYNSYIRKQGMKLLLSYVKSRHQAAVFTLLNEKLVKADWNKLLDAARGNTEVTALILEAKYRQ